MHQRPRQFFSFTWLLEIYKREKISVLKLSALSHSFSIRVRRFVRIHLKEGNFKFINNKRGQKGFIVIRGNTDWNFINNRTEIIIIILSLKQVLEIRNNIIRNSIVVIGYGPIFTNQRRNCVGFFPCIWKSMEKLELVYSPFNQKIFAPCL